MKKNLIIGLVLMFGLAAFLGASCGQSNDSTSSKSSSQPSEYAGKIFTVKSADGKVEGKIAIEKDAKENFIGANYHLLVHDALPNNGACGLPPASCGDNATYEYVRNLGGVSEDGSGIFSAVYCNENTLPEDLFEGIGTTMYSLEGCGLGTSVDIPETNNFYLRFNEYYDSIEEFKAATQLEIIDASGAWVPEEAPPGAISSASLDNDKAFNEGEVTATYTLEISGPQ